MDLVLGDKGRVFDFIEGLDEGDKIALLSHTDMDGLISAKVANEIFDADIIKFVNYSDLDEDLIAELEIEGVNKVVITDLMIERGKGDFIKGLERFSDILVMDHHPPAADLNSDRCTFIIGEEGYCAAYLCYYILGKAKDIEGLDWLVACASISDFCNVKNSDWIKNVFNKYGDKFDENMKKMGFEMHDKDRSEIYRLNWDLSLALIYFKDNLRIFFDYLGEKYGEIGNLREYSSSVQNEIDNTLERFEKEKSKFPGGYYYPINPRFGIASILGNLISTKYPDKTIIIVREKGENYAVSARRHDRGDNMNDLLSVCMNGFSGFSCGGHIPAAGGHFPKKYLEEFKRRLGVEE